MMRKASGYFAGNKERYFTAPDGSKHIYREGCGPYEYLMGALCGCFYSTLEEKERKGEWEEVTIHAQGRKRETVPTTLEYTSLEIVARGVTDKDEFQSLVKETAETCSIYQTISRISRMDVVVRFEDGEE